MLTIRTIDELRRAVAGWRAAGEAVAFVPTMGNLHSGHLALVARAREEAPRVVVSVFVNPTQFGPNEDFARYPRTEAEDAEKLEAAGADVLFLPSVEEMYPGGAEATTFVEVPGISDILCGEFRPGHFRGVATVVARLFNIVQPDVAVFGEKDYQQLLVIRRMVRDLAFPVRVIGAPTAREDDGLAKSSRNQYLAPEERELATRIHATLQAAAEGLRAGRDIAALEREGAESLERAGCQPDYFAIRRAEDLDDPAPGDRELVVLVAARLGDTRLIDNLRVTL